YRPRSRPRMEGGSSRISLERTQLTVQRPDPHGANHLHHRWRQDRVPRVGSGGRVSTRTEAANAIVRVCQRLYDRGLIAGPDGNVSVRISPDVILATPSGMSKVD